MSHVITGELVEVKDVPEGSSVLGALAAGATSVPVANVDDFGEDGICLIGGQPYTYTVADPYADLSDADLEDLVDDDDGTGTLLLDTPLAAAAADGDEVLSCNAWGKPEVVRTAFVQLYADDPEPTPIDVPTGTHGYLELGTFQAGSLVDVVSEGLTYTLKTLPVEEPVLDGAVIDPSTLPPTDPGQTFSTNPPPATTDGYVEGHAWWQLRDGDTPIVSRVESGAWVEVELISGDAAYFQNALIEALRVTGLTAVSIDGGSIYIAAGSGATYLQPFAGTALPAGWTATRDLSSGYVAPVPSVAASGYPAGGSGSVLLLDSGAAGQTSGFMNSAVTTDYSVGDFEALIRYTLTVNEDGDFFPSADAWLEFNDNGSQRYTLNLEHGSATLADTPLSMAATAQPGPGEWLNVRFRKAAGAASLAVWADGDPEPDPVTASLATVLPPAPVKLRLSASTFFGPSEGQKFWVDKLDVTELRTGFRVNPDGTGEWPAIGIGPGDSAWRTVGGSGQPAYENGWTATSGDAVAFRKSPTGDVTMVGRATPGTGNVAIFTLPPGYRPSRDLTDLITKAQGTGVFATLDILANGQVIARGITSSTWVSLTRDFSTL